MSNELPEDLKPLKDCVDKLQALLADPQPGLFTWGGFLSELVAEFRDITAPPKATPAICGNCVHHYDNGYCPIIDSLTGTGWACKDNYKRADK